MTRPLRTIQVFTSPSPGAAHGIYTAVMRSAADQLREESRRRMLRRSPEERLHLALRLGERDLTLFCAARNISRGEGRALLRRARQIGRVPSACAAR